MATTTAAQRREQARAAYDAYLADCPARQLLERISDKWVTLVVSALAGGPRRYGELARTVASISQKMLTQTLRNLERDGLVSRTVTPMVPVRVDYELTPLGLGLLPVIASVKGWAEDNMDDVLAARDAYDSGDGGYGGGKSVETGPGSRAS